jgi:V8-like Glu-specific endopeptidase
MKSRIALPLLALLLLVPVPVLYWVGETAIVAVAIDATDATAYLADPSLQAARELARAGDPLAALGALTGLLHRRSDLLHPHVLDEDEVAFGEDPGDTKRVFVTDPAGSSRFGQECPGGIVPSMIPHGPKEVEMRSIAPRVLLGEILVASVAAQATAGVGERTADLARVEVVDGTMLLEPMDADLEQFALPEGRLGSAAKGLFVRLPVGQPGGFSISALTSEGLARWRNLRGAASGEAFRGVHAAFAEYEQSFHAALVGSDLSQVDRVRQDREDVQSQLIARLSTTLDEQDESYVRTLLLGIDADRYGVVPRCVPRGGVDSRDKALYGTDDRFRPQNFEQIWRTSKGSAAIFLATNTTKAIGSAFLIGRNLVLTCRHVTKRLGSEVPADKLRVSFDYEIEMVEEPQSGDLQPKFLARKTIQVAGYLLHGEKSEHLDFSLLKLEPLDDKEAGDLFPVLPLYTTDIDQWESLYVVGHPQGQPRTVADNARVVFPHRISEETFQILKNRLHNQYAPTVAADDPRWEGQEERQTRILADFEQSYHKAGPSGDRINHGPGNTGRHSIGADCDTFAGNSGGPAILKSNHRVIDILFAGEPDEEAGELATYDVG